MGGVLSRSSNVKFMWLSKLVIVWMYIHPCLNPVCDSHYLIYGYLCRIDPGIVRLILQPLMR